MFQLSNSKIPVELTADPCFSAEISSRPIRRHNPPKRNRNGKLKQFFSLLGFSESNSDGWGNCQSFPFPLQTNFFPAKELRPPKKEGGEKKMSLFSPVSLKRRRKKKRKSLWSRFSFPNPFFLFCFFFGIWFQGGGGWSAVDRWQFTRQWLETGPGSFLLRASWWRVRASKFKPQECGRFPG